MFFSNKFRVAKVFLLVGTKGKLAVVDCPGVLVLTDSQKWNFNAFKCGGIGKATVCSDCAVVATYAAFPKNFYRAGKVQTTVAAAGLRCVVPAGIVTE